MTQTLTTVTKEARLVSVNSDDYQRFETAILGLWIALGSITMLFAAFTNAYIVRSSGEDWLPLTVPSMLWVNTGVIILSS